jgi:FO synthase subunit 2
MKTLEGLISAVTPKTASILDVGLQGKDLVEEQVEHLFSVDGMDLLALLMSADQLRKDTVGERVTYVVNRNINFTNVCVKRCSFCAFSRTYRSDEGYYLDDEEILRRAREAQEYGATEVCIQAGLPPEMQGDLYTRICHLIKKNIPELHIHAFSPEEILYATQRSSRSIRDYLKELKDLGIGSLPGTSAEILNQEIRDRIAPGRISVEEWIEVITTAHSLGIPTTSTIMYGHIETPAHCAQHLVLLRDLQRRSGGFTEFVPLSFVHTEAPMYTDGLIPDVRSGATGLEVLKMHAIARLVLNRDIPNIQVSWVKEGMKMSQACLSAGANDLGGTLMNESISTSAGASHGQLVRPRELRRFIRDAGRKAAERSTLYCSFKDFGDDDLSISEPLDRIAGEGTNDFGSYDELIHLDEFRYSDREERKVAQSS